MRQRVGLDDLYGKAAGRARAAMDDNGVAPGLLPGECPFGLDELLDDGFGVAAFVAMLDGGG